MRGRATALAALALILALPAAASAQVESPYPPGPFAPWDGSSPFNCELQDVGFGVDFPDPGADPFCVKFDKTEQNLIGLGVLDFLLKEPARVAAAGLKCFYYQRDQWTASVDQDAGPEIWNWVGSYFFDKARAVGGVNLEDFRILGQPASPSAYGLVPPQLAPYFDQGGGGAYAIVDIPADPSCWARVDTPEEAAQVYGAAGPPPLPGAVAGAGAVAGTAAGTEPRKRAHGCKRKRKKRGGARAAESAAKKKRRCGPKRKRR